MATEVKVISDENRKGSFYTDINDKPLTTQEY